MKKAKWVYMGDVNIRHGGTYFFNNDEDVKYGFMSVVRVTPCSDAGLPDNQFWIEWGNVTGFDSPAHIADAMTVCGTEGPIDNITLADCLMAYGNFEIDTTIVVQIGKEDPFYNGQQVPSTPDYQLRDGSSLRNWVIKHLNMY